MSEFKIDPQDPNAALLVHLLQRQDTIYAALSNALTAVNDHAAHLNELEKRVAKKKRPKKATKAPPKTQQEKGVGK